MKNVILYVVAVLLSFSLGAAVGIALQEPTKPYEGPNKPPCITYAPLDDPSTYCREDLRAD